MLLLRFANNMEAIWLLHCSGQLGVSFILDYQRCQMCLDGLFYGSLP